MAINQQYVSDIDAGFSSVNSDRATRLISMAALQVNAAVWGDLADYANALMTLHIWTLGKNSGAGSVSEVRLGDMSKKSSAVGGKDGLESTSYGREYKRLGMSRIKGPIVTGEA